MTADKRLRNADSEPRNDETARRTRSCSTVPYGACQTSVCVPKGHYESSPVRSAGNRKRGTRPGCDRDDRNDFLFPTRNHPSIVPGGTRRSKTNTTPALRTGLLSFVPNGTFTPKNATPSGAATFIESYRTALIADLKFAICYLSFSDERCPRFPLRYAA